MVKRASTAAFLVSILPFCPGRSGLGAEPVKPAVEFHRQGGTLRISIAGQPLAAYVFQDKQITRPFFAHVRAPNGVQVTRNHPPIPDRDPIDHDMYHPGIWLAFGDLSGADFWRNRARVVHEKFVEPPRGGPGAGTFTILNRYEGGDKLICREICCYTINIRPNGYLLISDSAFRSDDAAFGFGDQEEMGLGLRVATPITVKSGHGKIINSEDRVNESRVWGRQADWCDYSGVIDGWQVGILLMPDPSNFRKSWFHARDYGLLVANPFGQKAFGKPDQSAGSIIVKPGKSFRLRFGILIHAAPADATIELNAAYADYLKIIAHEAQTSTHPTK